MVYEQIIFFECSLNVFKGLFNREPVYFITSHSVSLQAGIALGSQPRFSLGKYGKYL